LFFSTSKAHCAHPAAFYTFPGNKSSLPNPPPATGRKPLPQQSLGGESEVLFASFSFKKKKSSFEKIKISFTLASSARAILSHHTGYQA